jgi:hypothetical protein
METKKNILQDEEPLLAKVKEVNVSMLDSELVISPPVAQDSPEIYSTTSNQADLHHNNPKSSQPLSTNRLFMGLGLLALLSFVALGAFLLGNRYNRHDEEQPSIVSQPASTDAINAPSSVSQSSPDQQQPVSENSNKTEIAVRPDNPSGNESSPVAVKNPSVVETKREAQNSVFEKPQTEPAAQLDGNTEAELNTSLNQWIDATNEKNVEQQMTYYAPKLNSFYRARGASINDVRDEKKRVFDGVDAVDIKAAKPQIVLSRDGRTAKMLFRKKYNIKKGDQDRNGEVIQEMKWVKTKNGWKIVSERDLKVINK